MIFVNKSGIPVPSVLLNSTERQKIINYYAGGATGKKQDYKDYQKAKAVLVKLFNGKCAYCESNILVTASGDVEHFRPKNLVLTKDKELQRGYYWLGADWDNLILSCELCNRKRLHEVNGEEGVPLGKQNQFPLSDESKRCKDHNDSWLNEGSFRLLLNPCKDEPEKHLFFDEEGLVSPKELEDGTPSPMGECTIEVVALLRKPLVDARRQHFLKKIKVHADSLDQLRKMFDDATGANQVSVVEYCRNELESKLAHLKSLLEPDAEYLALSRQILTPILEKHDINL